MGEKLESLELPKATYNFSTENYTLDTVMIFYNTNRIDTNLDCQRGYVWEEKRQQNLIDTIVRRERIPEFHVIQEETDTIFHFADGKQRITTIINFLSNKLAWKKSFATKELKEVFGDRNYLYFKDLPKSWQIAILNSKLQFAIYRNMPDRNITILFRKLNSGVDLKEFRKELALHIPYKKHFFNDIMDHPAIEKIFTKSAIEGDQAEQTFLRTFLLMREYDKKGSCTALDLRPGSFKNYYLDFEDCSEEETNKEVSDLTKYKDIIISLLDVINTNEYSKKVTSGFQLLFTLYYSYCNNYNEEKIIKLYKTLLNITAGSIVGSGSDYSSTKIVRYMNYISKNILSNI